MSQLDDAFPHAERLGETEEAVEHVLAGAGGDSLDS